MRWMENLKPTIPSQLSEETTKWIAISWIFKVDDILERTTKTAMEKGIGPFKTQNLPIPAFIRGK
jgi:hypothetical protein